MDVPNLPDLSLGYLLGNGPGRTCFLKMQTWNFSQLTPHILHTSLLAQVLSFCLASSFGHQELSPKNGLQVGSTSRPAENGLPRRITAKVASFNQRRPSFRVKTGISQVSIQYNFMDFQVFFFKQFYQLVTGCGFGTTYEI